MPAKLIIPNDGVCRPKLCVRINAGFPKSLQPEWEAFTRIVLICCTLWGLFWLQFVIGMMYNLPAIHAISGGVWPAPPYEFYEVGPEPFPLSLGWKFMVISSLASVVALVDAWIFTCAVKGRWRMRFSVCLFATILCGWSILSLKAESGVIRGLENRIKEERYWWRRAADSNDSSQGEWQLRYHRERVEFLEGKLREIREKKR